MEEGQRSSSKHGAKKNTRKSANKRQHCNNFENEKYKDFIALSYVFLPFFPPRISSSSGRRRGYAELISAHLSSRLCVHRGGPLGHIHELIYSQTRPGHIAQGLDILSPL